MYPQEHFIFGFIFAGIIFLIMPSIGLIGFMLIALTSVLVDVDHYVYYVYKTKDFSIARANAWFKRKGKKFLALPYSSRKNYYRAFLFLHGVEWIILFILLSWISIYFCFVAIGLMFHLFLDYFEQWPMGERRDKFLVLHDFLKYRKLKYLE